MTCFALSLVAVSCTPVEVVAVLADGGGTRPNEDGGALDGGAPDASPLDASAPDAGDDAGLPSTTDAGPRDLPDAGSGGDAGPDPDAGAIPTDGGAEDGGASTDAGPVDDAGASAGDGGTVELDGGASDPGADGGAGDGADGGVADDGGGADDGGASAADGGSDGGSDRGGDGGGDGGSDGGGDVPLTSMATGPATVLQAGQSGLLLRGTVLTPTGVLDPGEVLIVGQFITCVASSCATEAAAAGATWIDTAGVISPGLIDAHNHIAYNFLPEWVPSPPRLFRNRYEWANDPSYEAWVQPYAKHRSTGTHYCPAAKWGELRSLVHGTTTVQGQSFQQSCVDWGVRNAEHYHGLGYSHLRTNIGSPRDLTDADALNLITSFDAPTQPATRYAIHMAEGYAGSNIELEFDSFAGRDTRSNRHMGTSLLYKQTSVLIHSIALTEAQLQEVAATGAKIVWSPSSNLVLYGRTAPIQRILELGITTGLGPDWTPSGEDEMLSEMRYSVAYGRAQNIAALTPARLWQMATTDGAVVVGLQAHLGRVEVGKRADLTVFGRIGPDPYAAVVESRAADVRLVLIDGRGLYGDASLQAATARNDYCEPFDACGNSKYICVQESPAAPNRKNETLADIRTQLFNILEGIGYPADEQYHRGSDLLPLVDCSR